MPNNWKTYKLGEVADVQNGFAFKSKDLGATGVPVVKIKNIIPPYVDVTSADCYTRDIDQKLDKYVLRKGDFLISMTGSTVNVMSSAVGKMGRYRLEKESLLNQRAGKIYVTKTEIADFDFLCHYLNRYEIHYNLALNATGSANQANISPAQIKDIDLFLPPLPEQKAIASVLSSLDDKIELNLQMNKTLEEMAMTLYKHWFVDFGPFKDGKFVDSELGPIPEGWEVRSICDLLEEKPYNGLYKGKQFQGKGRRWLKMKSVYGLDFITFEDMDLIDVTEKEIEKYGCLKNDLVFGRTSLVLEGIGKCAIIKSDYDAPIFESNLFRVRLDKNLVSPDLIFLFFKSDAGRDEVRKLARQTAAVSITSKDLIQLKLPLPNQNIQNGVASKIEVFFELIIANLQENQTLTNLRDTLLPKLINGEVRVKDVEQTVAEVL